jgi:LmbE family N-acetylglucosaminyl deacetylase
MTPPPAAAILHALAECKTVEQRILIVVAHPDDETIGMGAQLRRFRDALLVHVTNGAPRDGRDAAAHGFASIADYASARYFELSAALEAGQANGVRTEVIGIADQEACLNLVALTERIAARIRAEDPGAIFVQPYEGGHPDHDAASFAVRAACRLIEAATGAGSALIEMTAYHAQGAGFVSGNFLPSPHPVTTTTLTAADRLRKQRMIDCFVSQRDLLVGFGVEVERFREAPDYNFLRPPHPGEFHYERLGWGITGAIWRDHARAAFEALGVGAPR